MARHGRCSGWVQAHDESVYQAPPAELAGWVQVYSNFRGSGGNTRLKQEAASSAVKFGIKSQARKSGGKMHMSGFGEV